VARRDEVMEPKDCVNPVFHCRAHSYYVMLDGEEVKEAP
jgi:hypothetical protein